MWVTWQDLRDLATCEAQPDVVGVKYVQPQVLRTVRFVKGRPKTAFTVVEPSGLIYARDVWRAPWRTQLAKVPVPCTLLTTFSDAHVKEHATTGLLSGTMVRHWFSVQCATKHPKLTAMPVGIDRRDLPALLAAPKAEHRDILCLANFQARNFERLHLQRWAQTQPWITTQAWDSQTPAVSMATYFATVGRSRFVLSPPGRGWDCYRTYEALALGAIPIVRRQAPLSDVVETLPVLMVDDWRDVTQARLKAFEPPHWNLDAMTLRYWTERIQAA